MAEQGSRLLKRAVALIERPEGERPEDEIEALVPWLAKIATPFNALEKEKLMALLQFCDYKKVSSDHVIIRQGDIGDCFFVMLTGRSSLYIDLGALDEPPSRMTSKGAEVKPSDKWEEVWERSGMKRLRLDRSRFGSFIAGYEAGKGFGEMALIDPKSIRNGSIISDDACDLLIIDRRLFNETLKERQEADRQRRWSLIEESPFFSNWPLKMKRLLDMSLVHMTFPFDNCVVRQGKPVAGLHFIIRGEAVVAVDPRHHHSQYPKFFDRKTSEKSLSELNRNLNKPEVPMKKDSQLPEHVAQRQPEADKKRHSAGKSLTICAIDRTEIIGALEFVFGLDTYAQTMVSTSDLEVFLLDIRSIDRIFGKVKQSSMAAYLADEVHERLRARVAFSSGAKVELYRHLLTILNDRSWKKETNDRKPPSSRELPSRKPEQPETDARGSGEERGTGPSQPTGQDDQRMTTSRKEAITVDPKPNPSPFTLSSTLAVYYTSHIMKRPKKFSRAYLRSRHGGYGRQSSALSQKGRKLVVAKATRLLPRSRRELEHVAFGLKDPKPRPKIQQQDDAIQRYLSPARTMSVDPERLEMVRGLIQFDLATSSSAVHRSGTDVRAYSSGTNGSGSRESDYEDDDVVLGLEETVSDDKLRQIVLKMGSYHEDLNEERRKNICNTLFDGRRITERGLASRSTRPRMTPGCTRTAFDSESSDETLAQVEGRLRNFYAQLGGKENELPVIQQLKRFRITAAAEAPIPAGTVFVCRRHHDNSTSTCSSSLSNLGNDDLRENRQTPKSAEPRIRRYIIPKTAYPLLKCAMSSQATTE